MVSEGEGTGAHQQLQKNKVSESVQIQPSHSVPSQKGTEINKELNTTLLASSQKVAKIEKGSQPGTQKKGMDQAKHFHPNQKCLKEGRKPN